MDYNLIVSAVEKTFGVSWNTKWLGTITKEELLRKISEVDTNTSLHNVISIRKRGRKNYAKLSEEEKQMYRDNEIYDW